MGLLEVVPSIRPFCLIRLLNLCLSCVLLEKHFKLVVVFGYGLYGLRTKFLVYKHLNGLFCW